MAHYFISLENGNYIVTQMAADSNGYFSCRPVRNFGDRQTDAIEFRNDCNDGKIDDHRIELLVKSYTQQPYQYMGKGNLKKQSL